ncbi:Os10g0371800 [Oryza sativa Japonica Group]|uniref:Os10g0371800 protein n=1 Tax=Oryza sativa subsp. japonica TaxID=39947 RepID=A0A0P0XTZ6_ORYSJ|nr:Os10g0371800 [Oryza sativa Japonica Group]
MAGLDTDTSTSTTSNIHGSMAHASRRARRWRCTCRRSANCKGKSKFVLEHQAMWEKEGRNKGYDTTVHRWRFATVPEGKILAGWEKSDILPLSKRVSLKCHFAD